MLHCNGLRVNFIRSVYKFEFKFNAFFFLQRGPNVNKLIMVEIWIKYWTSLTWTLLWETFHRLTTGFFWQPSSGRLVFKNTYRIKKLNHETIFIAFMNIGDFLVSWNILATLQSSQPIRNITCSYDVIIIFYFLYSVFLKEQNTDIPT